MSTVSVRMFQVIVMGAAARGVAPERLLSEVGVPPEALLDPDGRLPRTVEVRLWQAAVRLSQDENLGLHMAAQAGIADLGPIGFAVRSSGTLREAYGRAARYLALVNQEVGLALLTEGATAVLRHVPPQGAPPPRQAVDFFLGLLHLIGRHGIGAAFSLRALHLRHPAPPARDEYQRLFAATPRFSQPHDEVIVEAALLDLPQQQAEPALGEIIERHLQDLQRQLPAGATFLERTRSCLIAELREGEPTLERLARRLHMSPRSVQRRMQEEGTSLMELSAQLRVELARRYLRERQESIGEIAFLLGFSEASTFHRAFKRWTGMTPAAYRRAPPAEPPPRG